MFKRVPGTKDILPDEAVLWQKTEDISRKVFAAYNYKEVRTPIIEDAALFNRSLGEFTEIVQKQMFLIRNNEDTYALRPEGTACAVRSFIENNLDKTSGFVKWFYAGPMFRLERPQKGRLRQFHHIGVEVIGLSAPEADVEVISLAGSLLNAFAITGYKIQINNLGCTEDKKTLIKIMRDELKGKLEKLCPECNERFKNNVLRILDCKNESCQEIVKKIEVKDRHICADCKAHFTAVKNGLDALKLNYEVSPYLVRGLDYYTRTVFEIKHTSLGSQDAIGAGGRYDNLVKELGGPDLGAIGFALGIERILLAHQPISSSADQKNLTFLIALGEKAKAEAMKILQTLRDNNISSDMDFEGKSLKGAMRKANDLKAAYVVIIGEDELAKKTVTLKNMQSGEQKELTQDNLLKEFAHQPIS